MKDLTKRLLSILLALTIVFTGVISVSAAETTYEEPELQEEYIEITPFWTYLMQITNNLDVSGGMASIYVDVSAVSSITSIKIQTTLQKSNFLWWDDVAYFSGTYAGRYGKLSKSYAAPSGSYRTMTTVTTYQNGTAKETATVYTYS